MGNIERLHAVVDVGVETAGRGFRRGLEACEAAGCGLDPTQEAILTGAVVREFSDLRRGLSDEVARKGEWT